MFKFCFGRGFEVFSKCCVVCCLLFGVVACSNMNSQDKLAYRQIDHFNDKVDLRKAALINVEMGQNYLAQGQISRAKKKLVHALKLAPNLPEVHTAMGYFLETVGDIKMAEKHYRKAISLDSRKGSFHNNYGTFLCRAERYEEAEQVFLKAVQDYKYPKTADVYENAGLCAVRAKNLAKAEYYLELAIRYDPKQTNSLLELAELSFKRGKVAKAQHLLNKLKELSKPTSRSLWLDIRIARTNRNMDAVASNGLLLKNLFATSPEYKLFLGSQGQ